MRTARNALASLIYVIIHVCIVASFQHKAQLLNPLRFYARLATSAIVTKTIALTRERFANDKLKSLLLGLPCYELPCIDFVATVNAQELNHLLLSHDQIVITSPQSAAVFVSAWAELDKPTVTVISVGEGTSKPLRDAGIVPVFTPSDSTALTLAKELPLSPGMRVLYPTSTIADGRLVAGLRERGFEVTRVNTYTTVPTVWTQEDIDLARRIDIVTFASPSAVQNWAQHVGNDAIAVTIGPTSAAAARAAGFQRVCAPSAGSKGLAPWAALIREISTQEA